MATTDLHIPGDPVDEILAAHHIPGPWERLEATGVANRIYATRDVVLRIATDHPDAIVDAYTESVAAPIARQAGVLTPQLIAFDDSRTLVTRPFSLWERVHGATFGLLEPSGSGRRDVWRQAGHQIARLHDAVRSCPDPDHHLDTPGRELELDSVLRQLADSGHASPDNIREIEGLIAELNPFILHNDVAPCFLHNDVHEMNIMCGWSGGFAALIDWGDAGWGDPTLDFAAVPLDELSAVLEGYGATERLGRDAGARFVWDHLYQALEDAIEHPASAVPVASYRRFMSTGHVGQR